MNLLKLKLQNIKTLSVSAASGLVKLDKNFFVIADDELNLSYFDLEGFESKIILEPGTLPQEHKERKKLKPDWESLTFLSQNTILVVPSGSKPNRMTGKYLEISIENLQLKQSVDFTELYAQLGFSELNIEGSASFEDRLFFFQRGNGKLGQNGVVELSKTEVEREIKTHARLTSQSLKSVHSIDLGNINGHPLAFTDACFFTKDELYFIAVAENSQSTYDDGEYEGAVLGCLNRDLKVTKLFELDCLTKPEGLWVEAANGKMDVWIVTDADDRNQSASLFLGHF